jgi:hypothetical protein
VVREEASVLLHAARLPYSLLRTVLAAEQEQQASGASPVDFDV